MVAIVTGTGLGLERSSGWVLGSRGQLGVAAFGRYGENVTVNAANGNLIINRTDEILIGRGPDDVIARTYNSLATSSSLPDDNGDNWRLNAQRCVTKLTGTLNAPGSTVTLSGWDGSNALYAWDTTANAYICRQGGEAYHRLTFANDVWTWTDGRSGLLETYNRATNPNDATDTYYARIATSADADGNQLTYAYSGNLLSSVTTADGAHTNLIWSGNNLQQIATYTSGGSQMTRVRYTYDGANRLSTVTTDLTPNDNSVSDGNVVVTTYTYKDSTSRLVASISQTGGASVSFLYDGQGRVTSLTQTIAGSTTTTTTLSYDDVNRITTITDALNQATKLTYDANGQLVRAELPPAQAGTPAQIITYTYNDNGDVASVTDASNNLVRYFYDANDNLTLSVDQSGNAVSYTYDSSNQRVTETHYVIPSSGGWLDQAPAAADDSIIVAGVGTTVTFDPRSNDSDADGDPLTIVSVTTPSHGTATIINGGTAIQYTRSSIGIDSFIYTICDEYGLTTTATVNVGPFNLSPVAVNDSITLNENASITFDPRSNDSDPEGDTLTITAASTPAHGTVSFTGTQITYTPTAGYSGPDSFTYTISDGHNNTTTGTITATVISRPPVVGDDSITLNENASITFDPRVNDSDIDGDALTITAVGTPAHGIATIVSGTQITYTPATGYSGSDSFTYTISDGHGNTATATISATVINRAPAAANDSVTLNENASVTFDPRTNDSDPDDDALTITLVSTPLHGTATIINNGTEITYTPAAGYSGDDSFTYTVSDGHGNTATGTISATVVSQPPVAANDSITANQNSSVTFDPRTNDSDSESDPLTIVSVSTPSHGTATVINDGTQIIYTPTEGYNGGDSFTYTISDGHGNTATATIAVNTINNPPTAQGDTISLNQNASLTFDPRSNDTDPENDTLTITAVSTPAHGTATIVNDGTQIIYTPTTGYYGSDTFTYTISDGWGHTATATVSATVINRAPVAVNDSQTTVQNTAVTFDPRGNDSDADGDTITITAVSTPSHGTATIVNGGTQITYAPTGGYNGPDSFTYTISDGQGNSATATISMNTLNRAPTVMNDIISVNENASVTFDPRANDSDLDGDPLTITAVSTPSHGTATIVGGNTQITYTPTTGYSGTDTFTYTVSDGQGHTATATITVTVINQVPAAVNDSITLNQNSSTTFNPRSNDTDPENDTLTITAASIPSHGTATFAGGTQITYTPATGYSGPDSFTYTISDGHGNTATGTVSVTVVNRAPTATNDSVNVNGNSSVTFDPRPNDSDPDGDTLSISTVSTPAHGTATIVSGGTQITYTPTTGYAGSDSFTYTISDGHGHTVTATVSVTVVNRAPTPGTDFLTVNMGTSNNYLNVLANDSDPDGDAIHISRISAQPYYGTAWTDGNAVYYTPNAGYYGADYITYEVVDTAGNTERGGVNLTVNYVNRAPTPGTDYFTVNQGTSNNSLNVLANDSDPDGDALHISAVAIQPYYGSAWTDGNAVYYTPNAGYYGADYITYTVADSAGHTVNASINVTVNQVNQAPYISGYGMDYAGVYWDGWDYWNEFQGWFSVADPDGDPINVYANTIGLYSSGNTYVFQYIDNAGSIGGTITLTDSHGATQYYDYSVYAGNFDVWPSGSSLMAGGSSMSFASSALAGSDIGELNALESLNVGLLGSGLSLMGAGSLGTPPSQATTSRYVYDGERHLRFAVSAEGEVTEYVYNAFGQQTAAIIYRNNTYDVSGLSSTNVISESALAAWVAGITDKSTVERTDTTYDFRGNIATQTSYSAAAADGTGAGQATVLTYVYDQFGNLLSRQTSGIANSEVFSYDGLGRVVSSTDLNNTTTNIAFTDSQNRTVVTLANGLVKTSTYNVAGELISYSESGTGITTATAAYAYDSLGNLRIATDATGNKSYYFYDAIGNKIADIAADGSITEYRYDASNRLVATIGYATRLSQATLNTLADGSGNPTAATLAGIRPSAASGDDWTWRIYDASGRLIETIDGDGDATVFAYDGLGNLLSTTSYITVIAAGTLAGFKTTAPTTLQLPAAVPSNDNATRNYYDNDGRLIGTLDADGYLSQIVYNAAGEKIETISYANLSSASIRATASFAQLLSNVGTNSHDIHNRYFYDDRGQLRYVLDASLRPTEYVYDAAGHVLSQTEYAASIPALPTYSLANVEQQLWALSSNPNNRTSWSVYDTATGKLDYSIDAAGGVVKYSYDVTGNVIKQVRYATLRATASSPSQATMDGWASSYATGQDRVSRVIYDVAGRAVYTVDGEGYITEQRYDTAGRTTLSIRYADVYSVSDGATQASVKALLPSTIPASAIQASYVYDVDGRVVDSYDGMGVQTRVVYDALGRVSDKIAAFNTSNPTTVHYTYDAVGRVLTQTAAYGTSDAVTTFYAYDGLGLVTDRTVAYGTSDAVTVHYTYDAMGRVLSETAAYGTSSAVTTIYAYDAFGAVTDKTVAYGTSEATTVHYIYDTMGRVLNQTLAYGTADASTTLYSYDAFGDVLTKTDGRNFVSTYAYNKLGQVLSATVPVNGTTNATTSNSYNAFGEASSATDALLNTSYFYYDRLGRQTLAVDAERYATATTYAAGSNEVTSVTRYANTVNGTPAVNTPPSITANAADAATYFDLDHNGRVVRITDAQGYYEQYTLDAFGNRTQVINKLGGVTNNTFNKFGQLISETLPMNSVRADGSVEANTVTNTYTYDYRGNLKTKTEASGLTEQRTTTYSYDKLDRVTGTTGSDVRVMASDFVTLATVTPATSAEYDHLGNVIKTVDAAGVATFYYYDRLGRKIAALAPCTTTEQGQRYAYTAWTYDANGNVLTQRVYASDFAMPASAGGNPPAASGGYRTATYGYDRANRLVITTVGSLRYGEFDGSTYSTAIADITTENILDAAGNLLRLVDGRGMSVWYWYNKDGQKTAQLDQEGYLTTYQLDANGNVLSETRFANRFTGSASSSTVPSVTASGDDRTTTFTYDKNGRRLTETRLGVLVSTVNTSTGARSESTTTATIRYTYNGLGEVTSKTEATDDAVTYTYDLSGRQTAITGTAYTGDTGDGTVGTVQTQTLQYYDGLNNLSRTEVGDALHSATAKRVTTYSYQYSDGKFAAGGKLVSMTAAAGTADAFTTTYNYDRTGNLVAQSYDRKLADGSVEGNGQVMRYDIAGRMIFQAIATKVNGNLSLVSQSASPDTTLRYNTYGELTMRLLNGVAQETTDYDSAGRVWRSTTGDGTVKLFVYDKNGHQTLTITSDGQATSGTQLAAMTIDEAIAALGGATGIGASNVTGLAATITQYDQRGQAIQTREPGRQLDQTANRTTITHSRSYNAFGEVATETDSRGNVTSYSYTTLGKVKQRTMPGVAYTDETGLVHTNVTPVYNNYYDASGRVVATSDPNGNVNTQLLLAGSGYGDTEAASVKEFHADGGIYRRRYDVFGDLRATINEVGAALTYHYNALGQLTAQDTHSTLVSLPTADSTAISTGDIQLTDSYAYDGLGQRIKHWNSLYGSGTFETTNYDSQGRVTSTVNMVGLSNTYAYQWDSNIATPGLGVFGGWTKTSNMTESWYVPGDPGGWFWNGYEDEWREPTEGYWASRSAPQAATETTDGFGRVVDKVDYGNHHYTHSYDLAGRLSHMTNAGVVDIAYSYYNTGQMASQAQTFGDIANYAGSVVTAGYAYDVEGNRTFEGTNTVTYYIDQVVVDSYYDSYENQWYYTYDYIPTISAPAISQNSTASWDALNRMVSYDDTGYTGSANVSVDLEYDLANNIRNRHATFLGMDVNGNLTTTQTQDNWYRYDAMNRFVTTKGTLIGARGEGYISGIGSGAEITYTAAGQRATATTPNGTESYEYDAAGNLHYVYANGTLTARYDRDAMGRVTTYAEYRYFSHGATTGNTPYVKTDTYNAASQVTNEYTYTWRYTDNSKFESWTTFTYNLGLVTQTDTTSKRFDAWQPASRTTTSYVWYDGARQGAMTNQPNTGNSTIYTTTYTYNSLGQLVSAYVNDGQPRSIAYQNNVNGQITKRDVWRSGTTTPHDRHYYFNGVEMGSTSTNGTDEVDYITSINLHTTTPGTGLMRNGTSTAVYDYNFDQSYDPLSGFDDTTSSTPYVASEGDTLQSIAMAVYGDASLWYLIAEANGLSSKDTLVAGQSLLVPNKVTNIHNSSSTYKVYDPNEAIGDTSPTAPKPKKKAGGCGVMGQIILVVIAIVVSILTAGALSGAAAGGLSAMWGAGVSAMAGATASLSGAVIAATAGAVGSIVSQGVGLATGIQDKFSWSGVAMSFIGAGVGAGLGSIGAFGGLAGTIGKYGVLALRAATGSAITQGIAMAAGLQKKFDWAGVAAAGVSAAVMGFVGDNIPGAADTIVPVDGNFQPIAGASPIAYEPASAMNTFISSMAGNIANAATRSLINGSDFGDNIMAALPDTIGQTIGNMVAGGVQGDSRSFRQQLEDAMVPQSSSGSITDQPISMPGLSEADIVALSTMPDIDLEIGGNSAAYPGVVASDADTLDNVLFANARVAGGPPPRTVPRGEMGGVPRRGAAPPPEWGTPEGVPGYDRDVKDWWKNYLKSLKSIDEIHQKVEDTGADVHEGHVWEDFERDSYAGSDRPIKQDKNSLDFASPEGSKHPPYTGEGDTWKTGSGTWYVDRNGVDGPDIEIRYDYQLNREVVNYGDGRGFVPYDPEDERNHQPPPKRGK